MGHRISKWISRLVVPACVIPTMVMLHAGLGVWWILAVVLSVFGLLMLALIVADPGPRAKGFVEGLKSRFR